MHSDFSSSRLVRLLGAWAPVAPAPGMDFAERLGLWLNAFDAIKLQSALQALRVVPAAPARPSKLPAKALQEQLQRVRAALAHAIAQDPVALSGADPKDPGYVPFQRRHGELQRHMEQMLVPLREQVRQALAQGSPRQRQLAALDAVMLEVLAPREQQFLAGLPALLARRFEQRRQAHRDAPGAAQAVLALDAHAPLPDEATDGGAPQALALQAFADDWRQALLAELDLRLEPVVGLLAALNNEVNH